LRGKAVFAFFTPFFAFFGLVENCGVFVYKMFIIISLNQKLACVKIKTYINFLVTCCEFRLRSQLLDARGTVLRRCAAAEASILTDCARGSVMAVTVAGAGEEGFGWTRFLDGFHPLAKDSVAGGRAVGSGFKFLGDTSALPANPGLGPWFRFAVRGL
jgi:hypothetical protein